MDLIISYLTDVPKWTQIGNSSNNGSFWFLFINSLVAFLQISPFFISNPSTSDKMFLQTQKNNQWSLQASFIMGRQHYFDVIFTMIYRLQMQNPQLITIIKNSIIDEISFCWILNRAIYFVKAISFIFCLF